jgi:hypothetical protein
LSDRCVTRPKVALAAAALGLARRRSGEPRRRDESRIGPGVCSGARMGGALSAIAGMWWSVQLVAAPLEREPTPLVELTWAAPKSCPKRAEVLARIAALLERPLGQDPERVLVVTGRIRRTRGAYTLELRLVLGDESSTRTLSAPTCRELLEPAAVVVALAIDPVDAAPVEPLLIPEPPPATEIEAEPPAAEPVAPVTPEPVAPPIASQPDDEVAPMPATSRDDDMRGPGPRGPAFRRVKALLGVRGGVDGGNLPGVGGALEGSVGLLVGRARAEIAVVHLFERQQVRDDGGGGSFRMTAARPQACFEPGVWRFAFPLCGGIELGALRASGVGVQRRETARNFWLGLVAGAGFVGAPLPWLALGLRGELVIAPLRREYTLDADHLVTTGIAGGRGLAVVEVRLP